MAYAVFCDRNNKPWNDMGGFLPSWVGELVIAETYGAEAVGVDFQSYVWYRRALIWNEAQNKSYQFEEKKS